ncbi:hypothetical protein GQ457_03G035390 [Hibiscus cannabinus]
MGIDTTVTDLFRTKVNFFKAAVEDLQICWISIKHLFSHQSVKGNQKKREKEEGNNQNTLLSENSTPVPTNQRSDAKKKKTFKITKGRESRGKGGGFRSASTIHQAASFSDSRLWSVAAIFQAMLLKAPKL